MVVQSHAGGIRFGPVIFAFRTDASIQIGTGHVMRCLTLARHLRSIGHDCLFLTGDQPGNAAVSLRETGFRTEVIRAEGHGANGDIIVRSPYAGWLGGDWRSDAQQCLAAIGGRKPDWLVVDHYALGADWEREMASGCHRVMVIDDLADRGHDCDVLLDQNLGRRAADYDSLLPERATRFIGPQYALLRPEFHQQREASLRRRVDASLRNILVFMSGIDKDNATGQVLDVLNNVQLTPGVCIKVVMGRNAPWLNEIRQQVGGMCLAVDVAVDVEDMASLMSASDLAIGAAGGAAWERCCLGLPSVIVVLADNQWPGAAALAAAGAAMVIDGIDELGNELPGCITRMGRPGVLADVAGKAAAVTDGRGVERVSACLCN